MAKIVTITNPLTGQPAQVDQLDHTAQQIDDGLNIARGVSNPNLLDNWYFGNPVNQRGKTSYTGAGYGIDRWRLDTDSGVCLVEDGYIRTVKSGSWLNFKQTVDNFADLKGKTVTASALVDGNIALIIGISPDLYPFSVIHSGSKSIVSLTFAVPNDSETLQVIIQSQDNNGANIYAVKLELGPQQTLAHQDANGNWVLNEIPDYGEQLRQCQYYFRFFTDIEVPLSNNPAGTYIAGTLPLTMRSGTGAIKYNIGYVFFGNGTFQEIISASVASDGGRAKIGVNVDNSMNANLSATLHLTNCSIIFDL